MRFIADGPSIPDELLEARDRGNVVFLCGAGVSIPAGMPNFLGLAKSVVDELGVPQNAHLRFLLSYWKDERIPEAARPPLDQIFNLLQQEYPASEIDYLIARRLRTKPRTCVSTHRTILRLSRSADGKPQIVTTNFDLLFQYADDSLTPHVPPTLPDLANGQDLNGLVYLHGRLNSNIRRGEARQGFILSSSDFGRAYLAEGWATRFMRDLLDRYIVVLLGYSANDPPVEYLLQGLQASERWRREPIYAFDSMSNESAQAAWSNRGVIALIYPSVGRDHSALWNTLEAWAQRADDPVAWRQGVVELARRGPRNLERHERGQVASLVRTVDGAKLFADADPPPLGEWLCVFDKNVRYGRVERDPYEVLPDFDPLVEYGLDDDPPRPPGDWPKEAPPGDDLLSLRATDFHESGYLRLAGSPHPGKVPLSARLFRLALWIVKIAHEPVVPWWAAKHSNLHAFLLIRIELRIKHDGSDFPSEARSIWSLLIERFRTARDDEYDESLSDVNQLIIEEGWTKAALRAFERSTTPYLSIESFPSGKQGRPPENDWAELQVSDIAELGVGFPQIFEITAEIPDEVLPAVYSIGRKQLELALGMLEDIGPSAQETMKFYLGNNVGSMDGGNPNVYLQWFRGLLNRMTEIYPDLIRADTEFWPREDPYFFDKLRLSVWSSESIVTGEEVIDGLLSFSDKTFWDFSDGPELLHLVQDRWGQLSLDKRGLMEKRIIQGPPKWSNEAEEEYKKRGSLASAMFLGWLIVQGCDLSQDTLDILPELRAANPLWQPDLDQRVGERHGAAEGGWMHTDENSSSLINAPISKIIALARANTKSSFEDLTDYLPFDGLVKERPIRAVSALTYVSRRGEYPLDFWRTSLHKWPDEAPTRLICLFGARLARLPSEIVFNLRIELFQWIHGHFLKFAMKDQARALSIFDELLDKLFESGKYGTESGIGDVRIAGDNQGWSRRTMIHAMNGAVGLASRFLLDLLKSTNPEEGSGIPPDIKLRLERLIYSPGEGGDHAVCWASNHVEWLHYLDPAWTHTTIIPWFDPAHRYAEPAWNGFSYRSKLPLPGLFSLIRSYFLEVFKYVHNWKWEDRNLWKLHEFLVCGCLWLKHDSVYLTFNETRLALQQTNYRGRVHCIHYLTELLEGDHADWESFGKPFLERAWPKERRHQTEYTSLALAQLVGVTGEDFPVAVQTILPRLVPIYRDSWFLLHVVSRGSEEEFDLATRFPEATLALINKLVPDSPPEPLFDLDINLEKIATAEPSLRQDLRWGRLKRIARQE